MEPVSWQIVFGQAGRDSLLILPEIMLALFGLVILLTDCFLSVRQKSWHPFTALLGLAFSGASLGVIAGISRPGVLAFDGSIVIDPFFVFFAALCLAATALLILFSAREMQSMDSVGETCALMLFGVVGMMFLACGNDLVVLFVALEILAASFAVLLIAAPARRYAGRGSAEGSVKYFLGVVFGSAILAYGFSMLYGIAGSANLRAIAQKIAASPGGMPAAYVALAAICAGLFVHLAVPPFHHGAPDSSDAALAPVAVHVSVGAKIAVFAVFLRLFFTVFWPMRAALADILAVVGVFSIAVGTLAALTQFNLRRLLAYSAIAQVGYVLLALVGAVNRDGSLDGRGMQAVAFCLFIYAFFGTGAFALVMLLGSDGGDDLDGLEGFARRNPGRALLLLLFLLSFAGVPPTAGFVGVLLVISALVATQHVLLALFAALFLLPAMYCSLRVVRLMWKPVDASALAPVNSNARAAWVTWAEGCALAATTAVTLGVGILPERLIHLAQYSILNALGH